MQLPKPSMLEELTGKKSYCALEYQPHTYCIFVNSPPKNRIFR